MLRQLSVISYPLIPKLLADHQPIIPTIKDTYSKAAVGRLKYIGAVAWGIHQVGMSHFNSFCEGKIFTGAAKIDFSFFHTLKGILAFKVHMCKISFGEHIA